MLSFTKKELKDVKYVIVTMTLKTDKKDETKGLFLGYKPLVEVHTQLVANSEEFVWLHNGDNVYMLNVDYYKVSIIALQIGNTETSHTISTQEESLSKLETIQEVLVEEKRTRANGLIDVDTYELPAKLQKELSGEPKKTVAESTYDNCCGLYGYNPRTGTSNYSTTSYKRKKPSTFIIKRSTKYPISSAISKMESKIKEIKDGKYKPPILPTIPADETDDTEKKAAA